MKPIKRINKVARPLVRPCPCEVGCVSCGYVNISHILGCPYNCSYCFLHTYYGRDEIVVYDNDSELLRQVEDFMQAHQQPLRISTGQYSDSLALDQETGLSEKLIKLFARQKTHLLELKTKSASVDHLLDLDHKERTVFGWSVNSEKICEREELLAVRCEERVAAARRCVEAGYPVAFHFDPLVYYDGWVKDYQEVVDLIFAQIPAERIAWISLGALRFQPELKDIAVKEFPESIIFNNEELRVCGDGKMRYSAAKRVELFGQMQSFVRDKSADVYLYLCMEEAQIWQQVSLRNSPKNPFAAYFRFTKKK